MLGEKAANGSPSRSSRWAMPRQAKPSFACALWMSITIWPNLALNLTSRTQILRALQSIEFQLYASLAQHLLDKKRAFTCTRPFLTFFYVPMMKCCKLLLNKVIEWNRPSLDIDPFLSSAVDLFAHKLAASIERALDVSLGGNKYTKGQHVYKINLVRGMPFYGFYTSYGSFWKVRVNASSHMTWCEINWYLRLTRYFCTIPNWLIGL